MTVALCNALRAALTVALLFIPLFLHPTQLPSVITLIAPVILLFLGTVIPLRTRHPDVGQDLHCCIGWGC